ncbi:MAG: nicotinate (nicotinamide) nucleotide adenylyltransferase [Verrucomicrobiota bacterium]
MKIGARIALFGGTFDPVHSGHLHIARLSHQQAGLDAVIFLPCQQSPHKTNATSASAEDRLAMLRLAATEPWMLVDDWEITQAPPSYSYLTLQHFLVRHPGVEWFWIMGHDQWQALPRWKHPEILTAHLTFLVFTRGEAPLPREGYRMIHVQGEHPASASALRDPQNPHYLDPAWLPESVASWIKKKELYPSDH